MQIKTVLLTIASLTGLSLVLWFSFEPVFKTWRKRGFLLFTTTIWMAVIVLQIEILSIFRALNQPWFEIFWFVFLAFVWSVTVYHFVRRGLFQKIPSLWFWCQQKITPILGVYRWMFLGLVSFYIFTLAMIAYVYPPTNFDSMVYHLPRVLHWAQNQSVAPYATSITRQIQMQPLAEFLMLYIHFLSNADRLFNYVQLGCLLVCLVGISLIASELGLNGMLQQAVMLLGLSIPMAIMQATSTQNDLVAAAQIISFVAAGFTLLRKPDMVKAVWVGLALGLTLLTKGTSYIFVFPFVIMIGILMLIQYRTHAPRIALVVGIMVILINIGHYTRMFSVYGSPLGPTGDYSNEWISLKGTASNVIRTIALSYIPAREQYEKPVDPRWYIRNWLGILHTFTGLSPKDGRITWMYSNQSAFELVISGPSEDYIGSPWHTGLIIFSIPIFFFGGNVLKGKKIQVGYFLCLLTAFLLYCLLIRWQEWANRLLLPLLLLWMPFVVAAFDDGKWKLGLVIPAILCIIGLIFLMKTPQRPVYPDTFANLDRDKYVLQVNPIYKPFENIAQEITAHHCDRVGLLFGVNTWEYPLWTLLRSRGFDGQIEHINVDNLTVKFADPDFEPCAIVAVDNQSVIPDNWQKLEFEKLTLYLRP